MRERVKLKLSLLYCTVESVESVLGSVEPTFKPTSRRRAYSCTSRHRAYVEASSLRRGIEPCPLTLYATGAWSHCMSIEDASRCVEGSVELYIELYIEDVEARTQGACVPDGDPSGACAPTPGVLTPLFSILTSRPPR